MDFCFFPFLLPRDIRTHTERERERETELSTQRDVTRLDAKGEKKKKKKKRFIGRRRRGLIHLGNRMSYFSSLSPYTCTYIFCKYISYIYNIEIFSDITLMLYNRPSILLFKKLHTIRFYKYHLIIAGAQCPK